MSVRYDITADNLSGNGYRRLHAGDDYNHQFTVTRGGVALDLTGAKVWLTVKENPIETDAQAKLQLDSSNSAEIEITDADDGQFTVKFRNAGTADLEGKWWYDIQVKLADTTIITVAYGEIEFLPDITRATT